MENCLKQFSLRSILTPYEKICCHVSRAGRRDGGVEEEHSTRGDEGAGGKAWRRYDGMDQELGKNTRLSSGGAKAVTNDLNYYQVIEAESIEAVVEMLKDNPHIEMIPAAFLDIMEVPHMGM